MYHYIANVVVFLLLRLIHWLRSDPKFRECRKLRRLAQIFVVPVIKIIAKTRLSYVKKIRRNFLSNRSRGVGFLPRVMPSHSQLDNYLGMVTSFEIICGSYCCSFLFGVSYQDRAS